MSNSSLSNTNSYSVDPRTDIEDILDSIAKGSDILNLLERNPDLWNIQRSRLSEQIIEVLNRYRKKSGLDTI